MVRGLTTWDLEGVVLQPDMPTPRPVTLQCQLAQFAVKRFDALPTTADTSATGEEGAAETA